MGVFLNIYAYAITTLNLNRILIQNIYQYKQDPYLNASKSFCFSFKKRLQRRDMCFVHDNTILTTVNISTKSLNLGIYVYIKRIKSTYTWM